MNNKIDKFMQNKGINPKYRGYYTLRQIILNWETENNKTKLLVNIASQNETTTLKLTKNMKLALKNSNVEHYSEKTANEFCHSLYLDFLNYLGSEENDN